MGSTPKETTSKVEPWDGAKPYLTDVYKQFDQLLKDGAPKPYQGSTVANQSQATKDALSQAEAIARNGNTSTLNNATNAVNGVLNSTPNSQATNTLSQLQNNTSLGTNPTDAIAAQIAKGTPSAGQNFTNPAASQAANMNGYTNAASGLQSQQAQQLANSSNPAASSYLQQTASGANVGANPWLQQNIAAQQANIADTLKNVTNPGIDSQAASLGRMGSAAFASQRNNADSTAAKAMSDVAVNALTSQYNQDVAAQQSAANLYGNLYNQDVSNRLNANQQLAATDAQQQQIRQSGTQLYGNLLDSQQSQRQNALNNDRNYQLAALQQSSNNYQNSISNMLGLNDQRMNAANSQLSAQNANNNQKLNAAGMAGQTYQNQYLPSQMLAGVGADRDAYADLLKQAEVNAWDRAQQQPLQNLANFTNILNGGGYSNTTTPVYTNTGAQVLGGLSSLAGLFALCDLREKIIHSIVGYMPLTNGDRIGIYEFSYIDDETEERFVGPIAQEVEQKTSAVTEIRDRKVIDVEALMKEAA